MKPLIPLRQRRITGWRVTEDLADSKTLLKAVAAEFLGTGLFVFLATGSVTSGCHTSDVASASGNSGDTSLKTVVPGSCFLQSTTLLNIAMSFGFALFVIIYFTASFSGGHLNPAVTLAMFITQRISLLRAFLYTIFQCSGAAIGSIVLKGLDPGGYKAAAGAANQINAKAGFGTGTAIGFEIIGTFVLVFIVFAATDAQRAVSTAPLPILAPFAIGMGVFIIHLILIPVDGCSINPARSFGPAMVAREFHRYWVFWVGPYIGAIVAGAMYELGFRTPLAIPEYNDHSFGHHEHSPTSKPEKLHDLEAGVPVPGVTPAGTHSGMPIASGNTLASSTGVQGLGEGGQPGNTALDTNLPLSSGADLRDKNSVVGVAGLTTA
jgi:aquaporin PIP